MSELLPCPFCGGAMQERHALWPSEGDTDAVIHAAPTECPIEGAFSIGTTDNGASVSEAWNTRACFGGERAPDDPEITPEVWSLVQANYSRPTTDKSFYNFAALVETRHRAKLASSQAEVERLRAALEPFAKLGSEAAWMEKPDDKQAWGFDGVNLSWGDFRRARAALSGGKP